MTGVVRDNNGPGDIEPAIKSQVTGGESSRGVWAPLGLRRGGGEGAENLPTNLHFNYD